jgi:hypothetical protein
MKRMGEHEGFPSAEEALLAFSAIEVILTQGQPRTRYRGCYVPAWTMEFRFRPRLNI